jgi:hypothetical protein
LNIHFPIIIRFLNGNILFNSQLKIVKPEIVITKPDPFRDLHSDWEPGCAAF